MAKLIRPSGTVRKKILGVLKGKKFQVKCGPCPDSCNSGERCK